MAAKQAEWLKDLGNSCFNTDCFGVAIDAYTKAITLSPGVSVYWSNRALCHMKLKNWTRVEEDCRKAIQLDHNSVKAHYVLGLALLKKKEYADGIKELQRALDLQSSANPTGCIIEELWKELAKAKYEEWELVSAKRSGELNSLKETCKAALNQEQTEQLQALDGVFEKAATDDKPTEVPDYLCCNITFAIFRDPVIAPSGATYERGVILEHLEKVGNVDPISRGELDQSKLVPNLAIKKSVATYLEKHAWAYKEYTGGVKRLQRALDPGIRAVEEVSEEFAKAKYKEWELVSAKRSRELNSLKEICKAALNQEQTEQLKALDGVFEKAATDDKPTEVPDYLCCNITLGIFRDPVISPSGGTYERRAILEHLEKVGSKDPLSRGELDHTKLVPNLAIKKAVAAYLENHAWAYKDW